ncbi:MAG: hypothetical protein ACK5L5_11195 [Bacteroidales bacterium]
MKICIFILVLLSTTGLYAQSSSGKISKQIFKEQRKLSNRRDVRFMQFREIRESGEIWNRIEEGTQFDTLYILEAYDIVTGIFYYKIWNENLYIDFTYTLQNGFVFDTKGSYTKYMCELVEKWNIPSIRKEERENSDIAGGHIVYASMVIRKKKKYKVKSIVFKEFFNLKRDGSMGNGSDMLNGNK